MNQIGKISSTFDKLIKPGDRSVRDLVADGKRQAIAMCEQAGGDPSDVEIVELETIPEPYAMDGTFRLVVRVVSSIKDVAALGRNQTETEDTDYDQDSSFTTTGHLHDSESTCADSKAQQLDVEGYRPDIKSGIWTVSETDIELLIAGTGVLGVGCIGEATNQLLSLKACLREGRTIRIVSCSSIGADDVICAPLYMVRTHLDSFRLFPTLALSQRDYTISWPFHPSFQTIGNTLTSSLQRDHHRCLSSDFQPETSRF